MKSVQTFLAALLVSVLLLLALALVTGNGQAATFAWDGGGADNNWGTANNWNPNGAPPASNTDTDLVFTDGSLRTNAFVSAEDYKIRRITFGAGGAPFNITGETSRMILLQDSGGITNLSSASQTINLSSINLESGSQTWNIASGALNITGAQLGLKSGSRLTIIGAGEVSITSQIFESGGLTKSGTGKLTLSGNNLYTGITTNSGGVLLLNSATALSGGSHLVINGGVVGLGAGNFTRAVGTGATNVQFAGSGGFAAFNANHSVNLGGSSAAMTWASTANFLGNGQTLILGATNATHTVTFQNPIGFNGAVRTVQVDDGSAGVDATLSGVLGGTGASGLAKTGNGTLTLSAASTYSGGTTVATGKLLVNGSIGGGAVTVSSGATLGGTGTVGGVVTVQSGGALAPGVSIGTLTLTNSPTLNGTMLMEIDRAGSPNADKLVVSGGPLAFSGVLTVSNIGGALTGGEQFDLFDASSFSGAFTATNYPALGNNLNWWEGKLLSDGKLVVNRAPTASNTTYTRATGLPIKIRISEVLALCGDADSGDGDSVVFQGVDSGGQGATVTTDATHIFYTPANNNNDTLVYTVRDGRGGSNSGNLAINVQNPGGLAQTIDTSGGVVTLRFFGVPGYRYDVQRAQDVSFTVNVTVLVTTNAPSNGRFSYTDGSPPQPTAYYRLRYNP